MMIKLGMYTIFCTLLISCTSLQNKELQEFKIVNDRILLPVVITNQTFYFMLDTGAQGSSIKREIADQFNLKKMNNYKTAGAQRIWKKTYSVLLAKMKIDGVTVDDIELMSREKYPDKNWDGVIGIDIIKKHPIYLDTEKHSFSFPSHKTTLANSFPFKWRGKDMVVTLKIGDELIPDVIFDTGGSTDLSYRFKERFDLPVYYYEMFDIKTQQHVKARPTVQCVDATGGVEESFFYVAKRICIMDLCHKKFNILFVKYHDFVKHYQRNGMVGMEFFLKNDLLIDTRKKKIFFN